MAISTDELAPDAYQPEYPKDKIKYDISYNQTESGNPLEFSSVLDAGTSCCA